jgi:hypothetical protein
MPLGHGRWEIGISSRSHRQRRRGPSARAAGSTRTRTGFAKGPKGVSRSTGSSPPTGQRQKNRGADASSAIATGQAEERPPRKLGKRGEEKTAPGVAAGSSLERAWGSPKRVRDRQPERRSNRLCSIHCRPTGRASGRIPWTPLDMAGAALGHYNKRYRR